eukprot:CAMPEP_0197614640 /NCGR_PEP_ID=MMETSP1326-20131121/59626_1 /TAXON_ID=1155430 /ORGANISM="Genus nov. species nov., Strain RCC2288" /LENGTH=297 /DNA_ID=CAMNT_0043183513 /DNA_START=77 /DNA_END=970 /DNA_ORIENTATION=-
MAVVRAKLMLACAAFALLVASASAGSGAVSYGVGDCGKEDKPRAILAGATYTCCSDPAKDHVEGYEYSVTGGNSDDNTDYSVTGFGKTYTDSACTMSSAATKCTGSSCSNMFSTLKNSCSSGRKDLSTNTDATGVVCLVAKCNNTAAEGACKGMTFEFKIQTKLPDATPLTCPACSLANTQPGKCGALGKETDKWCTHEGDKSDPFFGDIYKGERVCCAESASACCEADTGAVAGVAIGVILGVLALLLGCCSCCSCCPFHKRLCCYRAPPVGAVVTGGVPMVPVAKYAGAPSGSNV